MLSGTKETNNNWPVANENGWKKGEERIDKEDCSY